MNASPDFLNDVDPDINYFDEIIAENHVFSTYNSIEDLLNSNPITLSDQNHLSIFGQNIRSLNRNLDNFMSMFSENNTPDVLVFSETWQNINNPIAIPGYVAHHTVRQGRSDGVFIFVKGTISACKISNFSYANDTVEICCVKVASGSNHIFILGAYRPFSDTTENFSNSLKSILNDNIFSNSQTVLIGDFNINLMSTGGGVEEFVDMMRSHHYMQIITDVTRPGNNLSTPSLIDLVWVNRLSAGVIKTGITDHYTLFMQLPLFCTESNSEKKNFS